MPTFPRKKKKDTLNTMWKINKRLLLGFSILFVMSTTCNSNCWRSELTTEDILGLYLLSSIQSNIDRNTFEPNNTKRGAYCIDVPNNRINVNETDSGRPLTSMIYPCDDVDYYKIYLSNKMVKIEYYYTNMYIENLTFLIENEEEILFNSISPEIESSFIESNRLIDININGSSFQYRQIYLNHTDYLYIKIKKNDKFQCPFSTSDIYYHLLMLEGEPMLMEGSRPIQNLQITGEFLPCPP